MAKDAAPRLVKHDPSRRHALSLTLSTSLLSEKMPTEFTSPETMRHIGTKGDLEQVPGLKTRTWRPGFAKDWQETIAPGVRPPEFKFLPWPWIGKDWIEMRTLFSFVFLFAAMACYSAQG